MDSLFARWSPPLPYVCFEADGVALGDLFCPTELSRIWLAEKANNLVQFSCLRSTPPSKPVDAHQNVQFAL